MKIKTIRRSARNKTFLPVVLTTLLLASSGSASSAGLEMHSVDDGSPVNLENLTGQGKWTLVMIWATTCILCQSQKPIISAFHEKHKDQDAHVVGIALDGVKNIGKVKRHINQHHVTFPNYVSQMKSAASHYFGVTDEQFRGTPTYLLFSPQGELIGKNPGLLSADAIEEFIARKS